MTPFNTNEIKGYLEEHREEAFQLLLDIAKIPSPSHHEEKRAAFCKAWLEKQGAKGVYIDEALNVIYQVLPGEPVRSAAGDPQGKLQVFLAHSDVVFPDTEELPLTIDGNLLKCPGVGDNSANMAALLMAAKYVTQKGLKPKDGGVLFVINSCEEGLGNLKGCRQIIKDFGSRMNSFIAFDGSNGNIAVTAVGSKRYRVEVLTEGGHSYGKFGNRNAIAYLASLIDSLYTVKVPEEGKTTYNVGTISGGTSVNTIAQQAEMLYEFRSDRREALLEMDSHFHSALDYFRKKGITVNAELVGERPCMGDVKPLKQKALISNAEKAIRSYFEVEPSLESSSTDCNIPLSVGIPAIALGCYFGDGAHTREEHLKIDSLFPGLCLCFDLVLDYFEAPP